MKDLYIGLTEEKLNVIRTHPYYEPTRVATIKKAEEFLRTPIPFLKFSDLHLFVATGNRSKYESAYNNLSGRLDSYLMAYLLTEDEKYIDPLTDVMWAICDVETWALPAHVQESNLLQYRRQFLELVSCNMGRRLGIALTVLEDKIPELVVRRVKNEIRERVINAFRDNKYWWMPAESNWSAVCIAGVLGAYLYAAEPEEIEAQMPKFIASAEAFLRSYDDEGCCKEGYAYWSYGFGYFCMFAQMLKNYTKGEIDFFSRHKVHEIAKFQENVSMNSTQCVRFSDCGERFSPAGALTHFLKTIYPDVQLPAMPAPSYHYSLSDFLWLNHTFADSKFEPKSKIFSEAQWFIHRGPVYNFACKAGYNAEPHNHNDVGSFLVSKNNKITFTDPGGGEYTRQYFSGERYSILEPSSRSHSVPIINGKYQICSRNKSTIFVEAENQYAFSMENAYSIETLKSLKRDFVCNDDVLIMTDSYEFTEKPESVVERFSTLVEPKFEDGKITVGDSVLEYDTDVFEASLTTDTCVRSITVKETLYLIDLKVKNIAESFTVSVKIS